MMPAPIEDLALDGLYLDERLTAPSGEDRVFIYTNFVASLDGRISVGDEAGAPVGGVPDELANPRDWRLYQELAVQADAVITTGRYVREWAAGIAGPILTIDENPAMADLKRWREQNGLTQAPATVVVSRLLSFDVDAAQRLGGKVVAIGSASTDPARVGKLADRGIQVVLGESYDGVTGAEIATGLTELGYRKALSAAGPRLAHLLIQDSVLARLYVTYVMKLLGGTRYDGLVEGSLFARPRSMELRSLYLDRSSNGNDNQLFAAFDPST